MNKHVAALIAVFVSVTAARADLLSNLNSLASNPAAQSAAAALPQDQVVQGLKEALNKGVQNAIAHLGHDGGFFTNAAVKITIPDKLRSVEKGLRAAKQDKLADDFIATMNHAAEQAVPEAASVFGDAVTSMSIDDAKALLAGSTNSATLYFQKKTRTALQQKFAPIVKAATDKAGVTSAYKSFMGKAGDYTSSFGTIGAFASSLTKTETLDVDAYVTSKTLDGLFKMIAAEEVAIRQNPAARTSDLLQKVFGAVSK